MKTLFTVFITILLYTIVLGIIATCTRDRDHKDEGYYKVEFEAYPLGRTDTIQRVYYTAYGPLKISNSSMDGETRVNFWNSKNRIAYREINASVKIKSQTKITKEFYDSVCVKN